MRVLLLNQFFPPDTAATGQLLADVAQGLARAGHEVHVVASAGSYGGGRVHVDGTGLGEGIRVHRVGATARGRVRAFDRLVDWGSYYALATARSLRLGRFDACLALTTPPFIGAAGVLLKRLRGTRLVLWSMDMWPDVAEALGTIRPDARVARALRRSATAIYRNADCIVSLGTAMDARLRDYGVPPQRIRTVHNWVPAESVKPVAREEAGLPGLGPLAGSFVVMYSGNMGMAHEFDTILDAAGLLQADPAVRFAFVGGGRRRAEVEEGVARRGLRNVAFLESMPLRDLAGLLAAADVHLVSMRDEVTGLLVPSKIYGILAAGRPALFVGPARCEVADLIEASESGARFRPGDARGLAHRIASLVHDRDEARKLGRAGRAYYERFLGRDRSVAAIVAAVTGADAPAEAGRPPSRPGRAEAAVVAESSA